MSGTRIGLVAGAALLLAAPVAEAAPYQFGGIYAGVHAGFFDDSLDIDPGSESISDDGLIGGLQVGYNYMRGNLMLGFEWDVSLSSGDPTGACGYLDGATCHADLSPFATFRPRVGYAADNFLVFVTGGVAAGRIDFHSYDGNGAIVDDLETFGKFGWTVGAGVEYMIGDMISVKLEYRYMNFLDADFVPWTANEDMIEIDLDTHSVMGGINWHF